jgi:hypothetical protein
MIPAAIGTRSRPILYCRRVSSFIVAGSLRSLRLICLSVTHWCLRCAGTRAKLPSGTTSRSTRPLGILYWSHGTAVGLYETSPNRSVIAGGDFSKLALLACFRYGDTTSARGRSSARRPVMVHDSLAICFWA